MRNTTQVLTDLLAARHRIVTSYPEGVRPTAHSIDGLLPGIAAFGVGTGLAGVPWREEFPRDCILFVGHNWGNERMFRKAQMLGGESSEIYWRRLTDIVGRAGLGQDEIHVTNLLQGIKSGTAAGPLPNVSTYMAQCLAYLQEQVRIIKPRLIVALGETSASLCRKANHDYRFGVPLVGIMHPSTRPLNWCGPYEAWVQRQAAAIRSLLV